MPVNAGMHSEMGKAAMAAPGPKPYTLKPKPYTLNSTH